jgi:hypothetical protein
MSWVWWKLGNDVSKWMRLNIIQIKLAHLTTSRSVTTCKPEQDVIALYCTSEKYVEDMRHEFNWVRKNAVADSGVTGVLIFLVTIKWLSRNWGSHSCDNEEYQFMVCKSMLSGRRSSTFRRNELPPSSESKSKTNKYPARIRQQPVPFRIFLRHTWFVAQWNNELYFSEEYYLLEGNAL